MNISFAQLRQAMQRKGYRFFENGEYNLNLIGIRNTRDLQANTFNDWFCVAFYGAGKPNLLCMPCTTDPGTYYRKNPANVEGTAIMRPGQYPGLWEKGLHRGQYHALVQRAPVTVWRDSNRDGRLDIGRSQETGLFGINCHRASARGTSHLVDRWSAGCQVIASSLDFDLLMALATTASSIWGNRFTYTLLEDIDL